MLRTLYRNVIEENQLVFIRLIELFWLLFQAIHRFCLRVAPYVTEFIGLGLAVLRLQASIRQLLQDHPNSLFSYLSECCPFPAHDADESALGELYDMIS